MITQPLLAQRASVLGRLAVRPHTMVIGTRTERAGEQPLDVVLPRQTFAGEVPAPAVYVPPQCVGTRRCPLLVVVPTGSVMDKFNPLADKYGIIVLSLALSVVDVPGIRLLDATLQDVLRTFAIDPDKIAIFGTCATGWISLEIGGDNLDVFSRIVVLQPDRLFVGDVNAPNRTTEFLFEAGTLESRRLLRAARELRRRGHRVTHAFGFRTHGTGQTDNYDYVMHWLQTTWATPTPALRPTPQVIADPPSLLTTEALGQMTAFWTRFQKEPDSIRTTARQKYLREVLAPVGNEQLVAWMTDVAALAAHYPSVAADLKAAGLTPQQHEAYRIALASARVTQDVGRIAGAVDPASVLGQNLAFMNAHPDEFEALEATDMWLTP